MKKYYGHAVIRHPDGWYYLVAYLDDKLTLKNSQMLLAWKENGELLKLE